ncbi:MAG: cysteine desulfurase [Ruminococcaceae bacterium]|nr:cysteine desulfurase [Oscillospiraceae bacterium]HHV31332.1 cysteine desulfurase [Clostridiales bacterium]
MPLNPYLDDFPVLKEPMNGKRLVYLDNAATTQKPLSVLRAVEDYYRAFNANPHRGLYELSVRATEAYENARHQVKEFIGADKDEEIIFTRNASESLNLVAYSYGLNFLNEGDEIVLPVSEHHSNLVPWQMVAKAKGAKLVYLYPDATGHLTEEEINSKITPKTRIVAVAHVSNVLGTVNPVREIAEKAHAVGAVVVVDCAQSIPHYPVNVKELDADFVAFSGHKMLAPMGIGVLYGKQELLDKMPPFLSGGEMIEYVYEQEATFAPLPQKFEAGTQNVGGALGLAAAIDYLKQVGYDTIMKTESELLRYMLDGMAQIPHITVYGDTTGATERCGVVSFNVDDVHPHDVSSILDADGVAIRAGHHCAQPLMRYLKVNATCRASLYFYNTKEDIDIFLASLKKVRGWLGYGA